MQAENSQMQKNSNTDFLTQENLITFDEKNYEYEEKNKFINSKKKPKNYHNINYSINYQQEESQITFAEKFSHEKINKTEN